MKTTPQSRGTNVWLCIAFSVFVCCADLPAYSQDTDTAGTVVSLKIDSAASIMVDPEGIEMTTVTSSWIGNTARTSGGRVKVGLSTNHAGRLQCDSQITLVCGTNTLQTSDESPVTAKLTFAGPAGDQYDEAGHVYLEFVPGKYPVGTIGLDVSVTKKWTYQDIAGIYTGTVVLEFVQPETE